MLFSSIVVSSARAAAAVSAWAATRARPLRSMLIFLLAPPTETKGVATPCADPGPAGLLFGAGALGLTSGWPRREDTARLEGLSGWPGRVNWRSGRPVSIALAFGRRSMAAHGRARARS